MSNWHGNSLKFCQISTPWLYRLIECYLKCVLVMRIKVINVEWTAFYLDCSFNYQYMIIEPLNKTGWESSIAICRSDPLGSFLSFNDVNDWCFPTIRCCCISHCARASCPRSSRFARWRAAHLRIMRGEMHAICIRTEQDRLWLCRSASPFPPFLSLFLSLTFSFCALLILFALSLSRPSTSSLSFFLFFNITILNRPAQKRTQDEEWLHEVASAWGDFNNNVCASFSRAVLYFLHEVQIRWIVVHQYC